MLADLLSFLSAFSFYSISMDCNVSYTWRLAAGEQLHVNPLLPGAVIAISPAAGLTLTPFVCNDGSIVESTAPAPDEKGAVTVPAARLEIAANKEATFTISVNFPGLPVEKRVPVAAAQLAGRAGEAKPEPPAPERAWGHWAVLAASCVIAVGLVIAIVVGTRNQGHAPNEVFDITDDGSMGECIPPVIPQRAA